MEHIIYLKEERRNKRTVDFNEFAKVFDLNKQQVMEAFKQVYLNPFMENLKKRLLLGGSVDYLEETLEIVEKCIENREK